MAKQLKAKDEKKDLARENALLDAMNDPQEAFAQREGRVDSNTYNSKHSYDPDHYIPASEFD